MAGLTVTAERGDEPVGWEDCLLSDGVTLISGQHILARRVNTRGDGMPYLTGPADFPDGVISQTKFTTHPSKVCRAGDILVTVKGSGSGTLVRADATYCISRQLMAIRPTKWDSFFTYYSLLQNARRIREASTGLIPGLSRSDILGQRMPVPSSPAEQRQIAASLCDTDDLISVLSRLITKKQAIKQGMMQELLTGKTRLPGFGHQWEDSTAGSIGFFKGGSGFPVRFQGRQSGKYPFFKVSDMNNPGNELFMKKANNYIDERQREKIGAVCMPEGAIVFAKVGAAVFLERKRILVQPSCIDNNMAAFVTDPVKADVRFLHYLLSMFRLSSLVATTALPSLNGSQLRSIPMRLPTDVSEQRAIADVLDDVDQELGILSSSLAKARNIKQGMMQELLSGRIRLPVEAAS